MIWRPETESVEIAAKKPVRGDKLTIAGYGSGAYREASGKMVQCVSPGNNFPFEMVEVDVAARNGDSGGPIFNRQGEVSGVLFGSAAGRTNGSHCAPMRRFLRRALVRVPKMARRNDASP